MLLPLLLKNSYSPAPYQPPTSPALSITLLTPLSSLLGLIVVMLILKPTCFTGPVADTTLLLTHMLSFIFSGLTRGA